MLFSRNTKCRTFLPALCLLFWAILIRCPTFNHPALYIDETWYLYAGGQLLDGYLPYIDVWDRKPFGLFLLYAPFYLFGKYRFLAYQLGALIFAWGTALFILQITKKFISVSAGFCAAALYLVLLTSLGGCGGQAPVFYNFFTAFAFYLVLNRFEEIKINPLSLSITGMQAMFLLGLGIELKPTVGFEGIYLGCFLLFTCWQNQKDLRNFLLNATLWVFTALVPTLFVIGFYVKIHHFQDWYFANILSSFLRKFIFNPPQFFKMIGVFLAASIVWLVAFFSFWRILRLKEKEYFLFVTAWLGTAIFAILIVPPYNPIYTLPFLLPFALLSAFLLLDQKIGGRLAMAGLFLISTGNDIRYLHGLLREHSRTEYTHLQKIAEAHPGCLFQYGGLVTMLDLTPEMAKKCHLTKYYFSTHLSAPNEEGAIGTDAGEELEKILQQEPRMILVGGDYFFLSATSPFLATENAILRKTLERKYHLLYERKDIEAYQLYLRNDEPRENPSNDLR
ncbi:hypothetical protein FAI41_03460 [Acetobacteraceae bacterium]|nr:hypothetical protein FAI41_03460 [Acetobacteraceae bacterium]